MYLQHMILVELVEGQIQAESTDVLCHAEVVALC